MARTLTIVQTELKHDPSTHEPTSCHVHFRHTDSVKTADRVTSELDVSITNTKALWDGKVADVMKEVVDAAKAMVNDAAYKESSAGAADGPYELETWTN